MKYQIHKLKKARTQEKPAGNIRYMAMHQIAQKNNNYSSRIKQHKKQKENHQKKQRTTETKSKYTDPMRAFPVLFSFASIRSMATFPSHHMNDS